MISPRWRKVLRDIVRNPTRTALVVMSVAVGIIAMTMVMAGYSIIATDLPASYRAIYPAHATLSTSAFQQDLVDSIARMDEVSRAQGERRVVVQVRMPDGAWQPVTLRVIDDFADQQINLVLPESGSFTPAKDEILLERATIGELQREVGDTITVKTADDQLKSLKIVGQTHDLTELAANLTGLTNGFITFDALEKLGYDRYFDQIAFQVADDSSDRARNEAVAQLVQDKMERAGVVVYTTAVPKPDEHMIEQFMTPMLIILGVMGVLSLTLSGFLVVNIITALMAQQTRQIGVMKSIGAQEKQIATMYLVMAALYGLLALVVAIPLSALVTDWFVRFAAALVNMDIVDSQVPPWVMALEVFVGIAVPVLGALTPVLRGSRITVREAISDYGVGSGSSAHGWIDRLLESVHFLTRPMLLSLRNTFRRKGRLVLTLVTLTLASAIFIGVFGVQSSMYRTMDDAFAYWNYDVRVNLGREYRVDYLEEQALAYPGVTAAEAWGFGGAIRNRPDDTESDAFRIIAPQPGSTMLSPTMLEGRWLLPDDQNAIVINTDLLKDEPDLRVGDTVTLEIGGREDDWEIVGVARSVLAGPYGYVNYPWFSRVTRTTGLANTLNIRLEDNSEANQRAMALELERYFESRGFQISNVRSTVQEQDQIENQFGILVLFLTIMAVTLAIVGGLGLMGTMSINVLERRREIGVMRSIGASTRSIMQIVIVEGVLIGVMSWAIGALLAYPISRVLSDAVGNGFLNSELTFRYSTGGALLWLVTVSAIAAFASILPARSAAQLTVREVLAYE